MMTRFKYHLIAVAAVTAWAAFSYLYLGVEDGSSGLSVLGWVHGVFFIPGGLLVVAVKGAISNYALPFMAVMSWLFYLLLAFSIIEAAMFFRRRTNKTGTR